jgi:HK97 family phage major capsid protein
MEFEMLRRLQFMNPRFDAPTDDGGDGSLAIIKQVGAKVDKMAEASEASSAKVEEIAEELATAKVDSEKDLKAMANQVAQVRRDLSKIYGASGADDYLMELSKFLGALYCAKNGMKIPEGQIAGEDIQDLVQKAAVDFTTTTAATAGYLLPSMLLPGITMLKDLYGNFYPEVTKITGTPGQSLLLNADAARPVASWRGAQATTIVHEATPMSFGQDTMVSELLGTYITIANELLMAPGVNFGGVSTVRMLKAILTKLEFGLIAGTTGGGEPSDGIIADATDQGTIASMTFALLGTFLKGCITVNDYAYNTQDNAIIMTPYDAISLAMEQGGSPGALVWGNALAGVPTTLMGYRLIVHPAANNGSNKHILLGDPKAISLIESASFSVDISGEAGDSFIHNESILRAFNHYDWNLGQASEWHKAIVTA